MTIARPRRGGARRPAAPVLGIRANLGQFSLLVLINAFVGSMVGLERTVVPLIGEREFGLTSTTLITSFIVGFGVTKALMNLAAARLADRFGRKPILVAGWLLGLPVPFMIMWAPSWGWIDAANVLLGANQAFAWSMTVIMKVDLAGPKQRGLALGLNEFAGYLSVALSAWATGYIASVYALRPQPFYYGGVVAVLGLGLSALFVKETRSHVVVEIEQTNAAAGSTPRARPFREVFGLTTWRDRSLSAACQAGLVNNLNDGMSWGIYPLFFSSHGLGVAAIGVVKAVYPGVWGALQIVTGPLSDRIGRKWLIAAGMAVQAGGIWLTVLVPAYPAWLAAAVLQGLGTAMVYPTLLAVIGDVAHPTWRATSFGVYRLWRDLGYAVGALLSGVLADWLGMATAIHAVAALTLLSGAVVAVRMRETLR
jgi:MFS family permease